MIFTDFEASELIFSGRASALCELSSVRAKGLFAISPGLDGNHAIRVTMQLLDQRFSCESPAVIPVERESELGRFKRLCHEYEMSCCVLEETSGGPANTPTE